MQFREEIVRGVRLAGFAFAALLICLAIRRTVHFVGAADAKEPGFSAAEPAPELPPAPQTAPVVPPPPVPETESVPPPPKRKPVPPKPVATAFRPPVVVPPDAIHITGEFPVTVEPPSPETLSVPAPEKPLAVAPGSQDLTPITPVFVVPPESPKQPARPKRWIKAVGRALHIGGPKDGEQKDVP